jgi:hypothetical protein
MTKIVYNACYGGFSLSHIDECDGYELVMTIDDYNWSVA